MNNHNYSTVSNLTYRELRGAFLEAMRAQRDGVVDQRRLRELIDEIKSRILDGEGLKHLLEQFPEAYSAA